MVTKKVGILVAGAGPTGLGAATRLQQHGIKDWLLIDKAEEPGGLSCTDTTAEGFLFDMGGHVKVSHYQYFDEMIEAAVGAGNQFWSTLSRESHVWVRGMWVAHPFQNNLSLLPKEDQVTCFVGLAAANFKASSALSAPNTYDDWIVRSVGEGIANLFHRPYNTKAWACPVSLMQCKWLGDRDAAPADFRNAVSAFVDRKDQAGSRQSAVFRFPAHGGTGSIWSKVAKMLPEENQRYGAGFAVTAIDREENFVTLANGDRIQYSALIISAPLDLTLRAVGRPELAEGLRHSSTHVIGIGLRGVCPQTPKCWLYFPEDDCPFHRATIFSHYAKANCPADDVMLRTLCMGDGTETPGSQPKPGPYWSLMFEVSESEYKPVDKQMVQLAGSEWMALVKDTILGAVNSKLITAQDEIVSIYHKRLEHGYPTPTLGRDAILAQALPWLQRQCIWSRGRLGSYKFEAGHQDHAVMQGVEAVDNILFGSKEMTLNHPNTVNGQKNRDVVFAPKPSLHHFTPNFGNPRRHSF